MRAVVPVLLALHGLLHLLGFAKAFGYASLPQLTQPIARGMGLLWLVAGLGMIISAVMFVAWPRSWWITGASALLISQAMLISAWRDASAGSLVNLVLLVAVTHGWLTEGPRSYRAQFEAHADARLTRRLETPVVTDADLVSLPEPIRRYLRAAAVVGHPRVRDYRLRFRGRIRSGPDARWMPFEADQHSFVDQPAARLFLMRARMFGIPVEAFHRFIGSRATMQVKIAGAMSIADAKGPVMDQSETVTLFNDMCLLAPGTLIDPRIQWETVDARSVKARFTNGTQTISATLLFNDDGLLTNFVSDDRSRASSDGKTFTRLRFSTPVRDYRNFGQARLPAHGEARWLLPEGEFTYGEFELLEAVYNTSNSLHRVRR